MATTKRCDLQNYIQRGVQEKMFAGGGIGFSVKETATYAYSNSIIPDSTVPFSAHTLYDLASITKSMVAIAILQLIEQGALRLSTHIHHYVGGLGVGWEKITIQNLLTNSLKLDIKEKLHEYSPEDIEMIITSSNVYRLGDGWYYHNSNSILLGWVLERFYGQPLARIIRKTIFEPAGMRHTFFPSEIPVSMQQHIHPSLNKKFIGPNVLKGMPHDQIAYQYALHGQNVACAGIFGTVEDVVKFGQFVLFKAFNNPKSMLEKITYNYLQEFKHPSGERMSSGLGFDIPKQDYVCSHFEKEALISTGHTGVFLCIHTVQQKVLAILSNITYPDSSPDRPKDTQGIPVNPLFDYRKELSRICFACEHCAV